jgi:hypothetical protein
MSAPVLYSMLAQCHSSTCPGRHRRGACRDFGRRCVQRAFMATGSACPRAPLGVGAAPLPRRRRLALAQRGVSSRAPGGRGVRAARSSRAGGRAHVGLQLGGEAALGVDEANEHVAERIVLLLPKLLVGNLRARAPEWSVRTGKGGGRRGSCCIPFLPFRGAC